MGKVIHFRLWRRPWRRLLAVVLVAGALWGAVRLHVTSTTRSGSFVLCDGARLPNCVIDGGTVRHAGVTIRLEDIDAPETDEPRCASEAALGWRATYRLLELLNAGPFEVVYGGGRDEDRYGRKLRWIERDGRSLGAILVAEGLARRGEGAPPGWCD